MLIKQANIYGFGKWIDQTIDFNASFNCIYGMNESGKSTIHQFILYILFGMTKKELACVQPKMSSKLGGRLVVVDQLNGHYTIERMADVHNGEAVIYLPNGTVEDEQWLKVQLHGMTKRMYQGIFSFSATELSKEDDLTEEELSELILSIGLTGSEHIRTLEMKLDKRLGEIFKPLGKVPVMNQQLIELKDLHHDLQLAEQHERIYRSEVIQKEKIQKQINEKQKKIQETRTKLHLLDRQKFAVPLLHEYDQLMCELDALPIEISFPANGKNRLEQVQAELLKAKSEKEVLDAEYKRSQALLEELSAQKFNEHLLNQATDLIQGKHAYFEKKRNSEALANDIELDRREVRDTLADLNIGITTDILKKLDFPFHLQKQWEDIRLTEEEIVRQEQTIQEEQLRLEKEYEHYEQDLREIEQTTLSTEELLELERKVTNIKEELLFEKIQENAHVSRQNWQVRRERKLANARKTRNISFVIALFLSFIAFFVYTPLFFIIPIIALAGILQFVYIERSIQEMDSLFRNENAVQESAVSESDKEHYEQLLAKNQQLVIEKDALQARMKEIDVLFIQLEEQKQSIYRQRERLDETLEKVCASYPFLHNLSAKYWTELLFTLKRLKEKIIHYERKIVQVNDLELSISDYEMNVHRFAKQVMSANEDRTIDSLFIMIEEFLKVAMQNQKDIEYYEERIKQLEVELEMLRQRSTPYEAERNVLFKEANVKTQSEFYQMADLLVRKEAYDKEKEALEYKLDELFLREEWLQFILEDQMEAHLMETQHVDMRMLLEDLQVQLTDLQQDLADHIAKQKALESSETYSELRYETENRKEAFNQEAKEWMILKTARELLTNTKRRYRDKYLTEVLKTTEKYFNRLTQGKYIKIYAPTVNIKLQVENTEGMRYALSELSQGTLDCLYVSLRLATSEAMAKEHRLPFIIDDAFVHFDYERTKIILNVLEEIGEKHQVIFFTCKDDILQAVEVDKSILL